MVKSKKIIGATEIKNSLKKECPEFWKWFFSETPWGETNLIDLDELESDRWYPDDQCKDYCNLIIINFKQYANDEYGSLFLEIENDL